MAVVVVDEAELAIEELAGPLYGLFDTASRRTVGALAWQAIGGIGIAGAKGAVGAVYLADVLGEIPAVGVPGGILLERQRAGGDGLRGVPGDVPQRGVVAAGEVDTDYLQVTSVDVALVLTCAVICLHL